MSVMNQGEKLDKMFSLQERFEILKTYFQSECSVDQTVWILKRIMGPEKAPNRAFVQNFVRKVRETGTLLDDRNDCQAQKGDHNEQLYRLPYTDGRLKHEGNYFTQQEDPLSLGDTKSVIDTPGATENNTVVRKFSRVQEKCSSRRCEDCKKIPGKKDNKTTAVCDVCLTPTCATHYIRVCDHCQSTKLKLSNQIKQSERSGSKSLKIPVAQINIAHKRCEFCKKSPHKKDNKTSAVCDLCLVPTCSAHFVRTCGKCYLVNFNEFGSKEKGVGQAGPSVSKELEIKMEFSDSIEDEQYNGYDEGSVEQTMTNDSESFTSAVSKKIGRRCVLCKKVPERRDYKTTSVCDFCFAPTCVSHYVRICENCHLNNFRTADMLETSDKQTEPPKLPVIQGKHVRRRCQTCKKIPERRDCKTTASCDLCIVSTCSLHFERACESCYLTKFKAPATMEATSEKESKNGLPPSKRRKKA